MNKNVFWSSEGSENESASEWLLYRVKGDSPAWITHVCLENFKTLFQDNFPIYPPLKVRFSFGFVPEQFHYTSEHYEVAENDELQVFPVLPMIVAANYVKVHLIGKPNKQKSNNLHYVAIRYVEIRGLDSVGIAENGLQETFESFCTAIVENEKLEKF